MAIFGINSLNFSGVSQGLQTSFFQKTEPNPGRGNGTSLKKNAGKNLLDDDFYLNIKGGGW